MANSIKIGGFSFDALKIGGSDVDAVYLGDTLLYSGGTTPPTPTGSTCYEVISTPIASYTSTTYDSVFTYNDAKWYMKNNLSQYEEYGIYDIVENISSATTYEGKLGVVGTTEYQYSGGSWSVVGSYVDSSVTYTIDNTDPSPYVGQELATTFKIPYADVESIGWVDLRIRGNGGGELSIRLDTGGWTDYRYQGSDNYNGTVTNDGEYFYLSLPSEAPQSIVIDRINYWNSTPIHLIVGSKQASVEYEEKDIPSAVFYNTVADMEVVGCPTVGINQFAMVGNDIYEYSSNEDWEQVTLLTPKCVAFYSSGNPLVVYDNGDSTLTNAETKINDVSPVSVYIGDSVTTIGDNAFYDTRYPYENNISSVTISSGVTSIGTYAFFQCSSLTSIDIPSGVTSIGTQAFWSCTSLTSIDIPNSVTSIGNSAFNGCSGLTSCTIGSGVTSIGSAAFSNCTSLSSITIPNSVTSIGESAFYNTPWWNSYSADTKNRYGNIVYINDIAYKAAATNVASVSFREGTVSIGGGAFSGCTRLNSIDIPNSVTSIGDGAFNSCRSLTSITIPNSVTSIGNYAFYGCSRLTSIDIPNSVTSISNNAFYNCSGLTSCTIGSGVTSIGSYAFGSCKSLTSVAIPDSVTSIGGWAFDNCRSFTSITVNATTPPNLGDAYVFNNTNNCPIYVPSQSLETYKSATNWSTYASRIQAIPNS